MELRKAENCLTHPVARGEGIDTDTATKELLRKFQVNEGMKRKRGRNSIQYLYMDALLYIN